MSFRRFVTDGEIFTVGRLWETVISAPIAIVCITGAKCLDESPQTVFLFVPNSVDCRLQPHLSG